MIHYKLYSDKKESNLGIDEFNQINHPDNELLNEAQVLELLGAGFLNDTGCAYPPRRNEGGLSFVTTAKLLVTKIIRITDQMQMVNILDSALMLSQKLMLKSLCLVLPAECAIRSYVPLSSFLSPHVFFISQKECLITSRLKRIAIRLVVLVCEGLLFRDALRRGMEQRLEHVGSMS